MFERPTLQNAEGSMNAAHHANLCYIGALLFSAGHDSLKLSVLELDSFSLLVAFTISKGISPILDRNAVLACLLISLVQVRENNEPKENILKVLLQ